MSEPRHCEERATLTPVSTAPATLVSMHESCRKGSLPLFLHRHPPADGGPSHHRSHHVNVGEALKRIKKVMFVSINHVHHESEQLPVPTILQPGSSTPSTGSARSSPTPAKVGDGASAPHGLQATGDPAGGPEVILLRSARQRHNTDCTVDSRFSEAEFCLDSDEEQAEGPPSLLMGRQRGYGSREKRRSCESLIVIVSALYCKLLVVIGLAFPLSEVISSNIPPFYYEIFYIYLYGWSILFLLYVYIFRLKDATVSRANSTSKLSRLSSASMSRIGRLLRLESHGSADPRQDLETASQLSKSSHRKPYMVLVASYGSFYLRMGAVLFGIGSMIYSGLEMGQYFEESPKSECRHVLGAVTPGLRLTFIFIQMYFVFLNASMSINKHKLVARFGLMHMVATNLSVWLHVVIQETKHELVLLLSMQAGKSHHGSHGLERRDADVTELPSAKHDNQFQSDLEKFSASDGSSITRCERTDIMGKLVNSASPFLFPCTIEYSLICAATLYVMWKNLNRLNTVYVMRDDSFAVAIDKNKKHQYSVDCARASKGLFMGILVFVASIISLILFFVLINKSDTREVAILSASLTELTLYCVTVLTIVVGMVQIQQLRYHSDRSIELDNILLVVAQTGVYLYASFNIIGSHFSEDLFSLSTSVMAIVQVTMQTMFILNASCRQAYRNSQLRDKPGREVVTFLLICNLAMWSITTFETSRSDAHPKQLHFFGFWAWTIISHVSMPLAIFYRFHSTVCLCEIWKRAYKCKRDAL